MAKFDKKQLQRLYNAVLSLKNADECDKFFEDICTIQELETIAQRLEVAGLIKDGKSYADISEQTGASTATVCRVGKCIKYGSGGYDIVLGRIER
ncbi:MAG: TrpR-like protein YerC/YecD [Clostridia bacterium]|nr:TrpR-like protein YerC/YecD [Clostridia bacterium]